MIGTAQFGFNYGIANQTGQPGFESVCEILRIASENGANALDTAFAYGESERVIGRALEALGLQEKITVVSKLATIPPGLSMREAGEKIEASIVASLKNLRLERIPYMLFHQESNIEYAEALLPFRDKGMIGAAGVSFVNPEVARRALSIPELEVWQIPSNLLDRRFTHTGITKSAGEKGITICMRSAYLQGLILMSDEATPEVLRPVIPARQQLRDMAKRFGISIAELALRGMLCHPEIQSFVVGTDTPEQLRGNLAVLAKGPLPPEAAAEVEAFNPGLPEEIVNPVLWPQEIKDKR